MLESTEKGGIRNSIRNCLTVFQNDPLLSGAIAKNLLTERTDIIKPIGYHRTGTAITDTDMNYLLLYLEETYGLTSEKKIAAAIGIVANENGYHPIRDYLNGLTWDGTERIRTCLHHFLGADSDQYTYEALRLFLLGAIHRAFHPGCKFEVMLCLVGGQGAGKSTFFRLLAVKDEWFSDDLRKLDDDNVYRKLQGHWIIEMSEMIATANAKSISYIQSYFPPERTKKILGRFHGIGANCVAALLGTVTPFCSCSSIPLFIGFTSAGLPLGVTFSFLISSPMVDLGSLVLLMSIFGWKVAVLYVILGLVIAVIGGTVIEKLHLENQVQEFIRKANSIDLPQEKLTYKDRIKYAWEQVVSTAKKVFPYVLVGVGIGAIIHNWIPEDIIVKILGTGNPFGVIIATIVGIPMYADIFGTIPIAEALLAKGAQLGVVLSFMMGVTTLSLPSMIMLKKAIKPKLLGIFIGICAVGIIVVGYFFNAIQGLIL